MYICIFRHVFHCTMTDSVQNEKKTLSSSLASLLCKKLNILEFSKSFWNC